MLQIRILNGMFLKNNGHCFQRNHGTIAVLCDNVDGMRMWVCQCVCMCVMCKIKPFVYINFFCVSG